MSAAFAIQGACTLMAAIHLAAKRRGTRQDPRGVSSVAIDEDDGAFGAISLGATINTLDPGPGGAEDDNDDDDYHEFVKHMRLSQGSTKANTDDALEREIASAGKQVRDLISRLKDVRDFQGVLRIGARVNEDAWNKRLAAMRTLASMSRDGDRLKRMVREVDELYKWLKSAIDKAKKSARKNVDAQLGQSIAELSDAFGSVKGDLSAAESVDMDDRFPRVLEEIGNSLEGSDFPNRRESLGTLVPFSSDPTEFDNRLKTLDDQYSKMKTQLLQLRGEYDDIGPDA